jgi:hypothetical protein
LDFLALDGAIERVEVEAGDLVTIDADLFSPLVEKSDPVTEGPDFGSFAWHDSHPFCHGGDALLSHLALGI